MASLRNSIDGLGSFEKLEVRKAIVGQNKAGAINCKVILGFYHYESLKKS